MKTILLGTAAVLACSTGAVFAQPHVEEVTITASPLGGDIINQSQSVAEVPRDELLSSGGFGLGDALRDVPGVSSSGFAPGAARPIIRGFDSSRVRVTENGIGSHDVSDISADHGVPIDPLSAIEVEVLRGPGTLRYGSQAIGGVVNAINNRIPIDLAEGVSAEGFLAGATNALERSAGGLVDYRSGPWALHADGVIRGADDYDTPDGEQENTFAFGHAFAFGGGYLGAMNAAGLSFNRYASRYGIPSEPGGEVAHIELDQNRYAGAARFRMPFAGVDSANLRGGYSDYSHDEIAEGEGVAATFTNREWEARGEVLHSGVGPIATGAVGAQWSTRDFSAGGHGEDYLLPTDSQSFALYAFERFALGARLVLEAAARVDWSDVSGSTAALGRFDRSFTLGSFAAGLVYRPLEELSLGVNLSQTQRAPNVVELFAQGPHEASATFEFGDPTIGKEQSRSAEFVLHYDGADDRHATFSAFHSSFDGYIAGLLTGNSYDEDGNFFPDGSAEFAELLYAQRDATFWGLEAQGHLPLAALANGMFGINAQLDYVRAEFDAGGNVPRIPPFRYGGGVFFERDGLELRLDVLRTSEQTKLAANETPTAGYTMVDASARVRIFESDAGTLDIALTGSNLTDERARNHVSFTKDRVLLPGRNIRLMLHFAH